MRTYQFLLKKGSWLLASLIIIFSLLAFPSCNDKKKAEKKVMTTTLKDININASCFELPKSKMQTAWVDPGHLSSITYIAFYTSWDPVSDMFGVQARAYDVNNNSLGDPITLSKGADCAIILPPLAIGENTIGMGQLGIVNAGQLTNFTHLLVTPKKFTPPSPGPAPTGDYLGYDIQVIGETGPTQSAPTLPCPPCQYCRPPCDTAISNDTLPISSAKDTNTQKSQ